MYTYIHIYVEPFIGWANNHFKKLVFAESRLHLRPRGKFGQKHVRDTHTHTHHYIIVYYSIVYKMLYIYIYIYI